MLFWRDLSFARGLPTLPSRPPTQAGPAQAAVD
jgi:hypothetical protein